MKRQIQYQDSLMEMAYSKQHMTNVAHMKNANDNEIPHHTGEYIVVRHEKWDSANKTLSAMAWTIPHHRGT